MPKTRYKIYLLSARAVISHAVLRDGVYTVSLDAAATGKCKVSGASHEQDGNALFYQIMCQLRGGRYREPRDEKVIPDLSEIIFYMNFEGIFDRNNLERQKKAEDLFRPEGVTLDFGSGPHRYVAFERSASMSRDSRLSFIRADYYEPVRRRIMLDMEIDRCQLTKLYAYNGLMLSGGVRIDGIRIHKNSRVIVVDNPTTTVEHTSVITAVDDGSRGSIRRYHRYDTIEDVKVTCFDGVGLISKEYAAVINCAYDDGCDHTSFQIRMPYVKGMLHQVDFKDFLKRTGTQVIQDIWGKKHSVENIDIILTRSMFKAYGWLNECGMTWKDYWKAFQKYDHALYITNVSRAVPQEMTELNYQFLVTLSIQPEEFRPADLPDGWTHSPTADQRAWLTKETELAYYNFRANAYFRISHFLKPLYDPFVSKRSRAYRMAKILEKNSLFIHEPVYASELEAQAESILKNYSQGHLIVAGDTRFLSGDLLELMRRLVWPRSFLMPDQRRFNDELLRYPFDDEHFFAPMAAYDHGDSCTLLRNPHIARNEELQLSFYDDIDYLRQEYLGHLSDVVMVSAASLAADRLGGADYDGDLIRTITDPIVNRCVLRNYEYEYHQSLKNGLTAPFLRIPSLSGPKKSAKDWHACFETVRDTFSTRIGQICNAALDRSVIAYSDSADAGERKRCRRETELLAILTGLEIDSAKTGIRPDLSEYLKERTVKRSLFLQYKTLMEKAEKRRAWYEPTHKEKIRKFFESTDWSKVESPIDRLPYLAWQLERNTPKIKPRPAADAELFTFAAEDGWKDKLDQSKLRKIEALLTDYERCLSRIRACRVPVKDAKRRSDISRTLFLRGQEERYDVEELYALFRQLPPERVTILRQALIERKWHLMDTEEREVFLLEQLPEPELAERYDLLMDFRSGGFRVLGDLVCDIDDENAAYERKQLDRDTDSPAFRAMMAAYKEKPFSSDYKAAVSSTCRALLNKIVSPGKAVPYVVALGKRNLLWDLLIDRIEEHVRKREV